MDPVHDPRCRALSTDALHAGMDQDETGVTAALEMLVDEYGSAGTEAAIMMWCDTLIRHTGGWSRSTRLQFERYGSDDTVPIEDVAPEALWAGRILAAWRVRDRHQYEALLSVITDNPDLATTYVAELLTVVVATLTAHFQECHTANETPRGRRRGPADWTAPPPGSTWN
jgi:hypothetical protein